MIRREFITLICGAAAMPLAARAAARPDAADRRADGVCRERPGRTDLGRGVPRGTPEARVDGGQYPDRHTLGAADVESMQRFTKELIALQPGFILAQNTPTTKDATNAHHPHHFWERFRSGGQRLRREFSTARR